MAGRMDCHGESDIGLVRESNEDQFLIADLQKSVLIHQTSLSYDDETELRGGSQAKLMLVADGVGAGPAGNRASQLALEGVVQYLLNAIHWLFKPEDVREEAFMQDLQGVLQFSHEKIQQAAEHGPSRHGMGSTITLAYVVWPELYLVHAGDSRAYLFRNGELLKLTDDQATAESPDGGLLPRAQIERSPLNQVLSSLAGGDAGELQPLVYRFRLAMEDTVLLCTDGLTDHLSETDIAEVLDRQKSAKAACQTLIAETNQAGGRDNTTVVVARFTDKQNAAAAATQTAARIEDTDRPQTAATASART